MFRKVYYEYDCTSDCTTVLGMEQERGELGGFGDEGDRRVLNERKAMCVFSLHSITIRFRDRQTEKDTATHTATHSKEH